MTTGAKALAEARRLAPLIKRDPVGYGNYVNVQDWPPNTPKYSWPVMGSVDHCGLSMNTTQFNIGMGAPGGRYPDSAWTPSGLEWYRQRGRVVPLAAARAGDIAYWQNHGSQYTATHVSMVRGPVTAEGVPTLGFNETPEGGGVEDVIHPTNHPIRRLVAICRPDYDETRGLACYPIDKAYPVTSGFGVRWNQLHDGIDFGTPVGTPIYAAHDGVVNNPPFDTGGYGIWVQVNGVGGWSQYGHLSRNNVVASGTYVTAGTVIGYSGNTGDSTGPHLHLRWRPAGAGPTDPAPYLQGKPYALDYQPPTPDIDRPTIPPALVSLLTQTQEADVAQIIDIYDPETGQVKFHMMNVGGVVSPTTGPYADEDNGFTRVRIALPDWEAREDEQLRQLARLRDYFNEKPEATQ